MTMKKVIELRHQGECEDLNESNDDTISDKWLKAGVATRLLVKKHFFNSKFGLGGNQSY
jgi:hypothetical protein